MNYLSLKRMQEPIQMIELTPEWKEFLELLAYMEKIRQEELTKLGIPAERMGSPKPPR